MNRTSLLGVLAIAAVVFIVWAPARALLFGGPFGGGASGEWVGTMTITAGYTIPPTPDPAATPLVPPRKAAVYLNLSPTDSFLREYGGPGELHVVGDSNAIPFRLVGLTISATPGANFISDQFVTNGVHVAPFRPGTLHFQNFGFPGMRSNLSSFTVDLHPGTQADYRHLFTSLSEPNPTHSAAACNSTHPILPGAKHA